MRDEFAVVATPEPERNLPTQIPAPRLLIGFDLADPLPDAIALGLGEGGRYRQEQLAKPVAGNVAPKIEQMQSDATRL